MPYKSILVHVDESNHVDARIEIAAKIAMTEDAHLIGVAMTGISRFLYQTMAFNQDASVINPYFDTLRQQAGNALKRFEGIVAKIGVPSYESRLADDEAAGGISLHTRYCDLAVLGQYNPEEFYSTLNSDLPEYVVMNSACPVLIVPYAGSFKKITDKILIAWNASMEATRTIHNAIPLLKQATMVDLAVFNPESRADAHGQQPGADIALYLSRHGITVNVMQETTDGDIGNALLSLAADLNTDMLVMGCYGHSRFREILLGGATRTILQSMTIPVLMSH
jgi:nucleotide-binding universal stress UspA family protein